MFGSVAWTTRSESLKPLWNPVIDVNEAGFLPHVGVGGCSVSSPQVRVDERELKFEFAPAPET